MGSGSIDRTSRPSYNIGTFIGTNKRTVFEHWKEVLNMIATKQMDVRANIKKYFDLAFSGEPVIVSRKENKNVVIVSEHEYNELQKAKRNTEYQSMLDESFKQLKDGKTISFSMEELQAMESDDWKPTKKVLDFMERMKKYKNCFLQGTL
jgi:antitoxin YefM